MTLLAEHIPEHGRAAGEPGSPDAEQLQPLVELGARRSRLADARQVALDVGHEDRDADGAETLGQHLQRHGLAGAGGAGDEAVPVRQRGQEREFGAAFRAMDSGSGMERLRLTV